MRVEKDIVVSAPVERVYELWTDFENFPRFMHHVEEVRRTGGNMLHWKAKLGPVTVEWDAEIKALVPNRTVTWHSTSGAENAGAITLAAKGHITEMHVVIEYSPNLFERLADTVTREMSRSVEQDLERFRALAEGRDVEEGGGRSVGRIGAMVEQVAGTLGLGGKSDDDGGSGGRSSADRGSSTTSSMSSGGSSMSSASMGGGRGSSSAGSDTESTTDETAGSSTPSAAERAARNVEIEGLGSDESPGEAVGSTSPEEIAAARAALGGTPDTSSSGNTASTGDTGSWNRNMSDVVGGDAGGPPTSSSATSSSQLSGRSSVPSTGEMGLGTSGETPSQPRGRVTDFLGDAAADTAGVQDSMAGAPGNTGDQAGGMRGVAPTRGDVDASSPDAPATELTPPTSGGPMGPSLMTYEAGTGPKVPATGTSDLGSMADDRTALGSTSVSTGSMTDTGRARDTGGMAGGASGFTTESTSSLAGQGDLGGGPDDVGGQATTPDLGHAPQGGGAGRGSGDAYGSGITQTGGPHSYAMPTDATAADLTTVPGGGIGSGTMLGDLGSRGSADRGDMVIATGNSPRDLGGADDGGSTDRGDMVIATGNSPRDLGGADDDTEPSPADDASVGGTGATYSGGTGGWGTETPGSSGVAGWTPSSTDTESNRTGGGETH